VSLGDVLLEAFEHSVNDVLDGAASGISDSDLTLFKSHIKMDLEQ